MRSAVALLATVFAASAVMVACAWLSQLQLQSQPARERFAEESALTRTAQSLMCSPWNRGACGADASIKGRLYIGDETMTPTPDYDKNNSDPYYLEKVLAGRNNSSLRLTINDDPQESFQIWGDACNEGNCAGAGAVRHTFWAGGDAEHKGAVRAASLCAGGECLSKDEVAALKRMAAAPATN